MAQVSQLSRADMRLFLRQLQTNPADVTQWGPMMRMSLVRVSLIDFTIHDRRIASTLRFALMALFPSVLAHLAKHSHAPAIDFTFEIPKERRVQKGDATKIILGKVIMPEDQIKIHEAALVAIAQWTTALCTPTPRALDIDSFPIKTCLRFICTHTLGGPSHVPHLTDKFIAQAEKPALSSYQITEFVKSCRGENDALLAGLAQKLVEKKLKVEIAKEQFELFLGMAGNELLKKKIETLREGNRFEASATCSEVKIKTSTNRATLQAYPAMEVDKKNAVDGGDINAAMAGGAHVGKDDSQISFPLCQANTVEEDLRTCVLQARLNVNFN